MTSSIIMQTATIQTTVATAQSNAAMAQAVAAQEAACKARINDGYKHNPADVGAAREYAECVERLHPRDTESHMPIGIKAGLVTLLVAVIVGAAMNRDSRLVGALSGLTVGAIAAVMIGLFVRLFV